MPKYALRGTDIIPIEEAKVSVMTGVVNYGLGAFEGIRGYWDTINNELHFFRLEDHLQRLQRSAKFLHISLPASVPELAGAICRLAREEGYEEDVYIRPLAFKTTLKVGGRLDRLEDDILTWVVLTKDDPRMERGIRVVISGWRRIDVAVVPPQAKLTGSYISSVLARTAAQTGGYDDCIFLNSTGHVAEGSGWNIFLRKGDILVTPSVTEGILEGITRATILEIAQKKLGMMIQERQVDPSELLVAEEVFGCGTGIQLLPIVEVDGWKIGGGKPGEVFGRLWDLYSRIVRNKEPDYQQWLTPVYHGYATGR